MKSSKTGTVQMAGVVILLLVLSLLSSGLKAPPERDITEENLPSQINIKGIPFFPTDLNKDQTFISLNSRFKLAFDEYVDVKKATRGDVFKIHVLEDFYLTPDQNQILITKGSWLRGKISFVKKPNIFNKSSAISAHLDTLVTPYGEMIPIDLYLNIQKGILNADEELEPADKALETAYNQIEILKLDFKSPEFLSKFLSGTLIGLVLQNGSNTFYKGQEIQVVIKKNIELIGHNFPN